MPEKTKGERKTKASPKSKSGKSANSTPASPASGDPRAIEKVSSDLARLLDEQSFETTAEANAFVGQYAGVKGIPLPSRGLTPLEQAQDAMYEAWEARSRKTRVKLAREALSISADCADAYVLLAEETARTPEEALKLYEEGMRAGERALGQEMFDKDAGHFWGILRTRPYMRARRGAAECLWETGEVERAMEHFRELLRLNPNDSQGNRYLLAQLLLQEDRDEELGTLLDEYRSEASADWLYTRALWTFRSEGAGRRATRALQEALASNVYVPLFLLELRALPLEVPDYISRGEESEGIHYVISYGAYWMDTPGAIEWFAAVFKAALAEVEKKAKAEDNERKLRLIMGH